VAGRRASSRFGAVSEEGSKPTDVLANERTFLAYVRTSLAFVAFGFVIARFALFAQEFGAVLHVHEINRGESIAFGTAMALFGSVVAAYGGYRYLVVARALDAREVVRSDRVGVIVGALAVVAIGLVVGVGLIALR
jgi:putative membrane protein